MDLEEILSEAGPLIEKHGDHLFKLGQEHSKIVLFQILRDLMQEKHSTNDQIAVETIAWLWIEAAERYSNL